MLRRPPGTRVVDNRKHGILVVEDDPAIRRLVTMVLQRQGYQVEVAVDGNPVKLTSHEYRLLSYLMHHTGRIVSRGELTEHLYDQDFDRDSNTIEVFIGRLRKKLGVDIIQTVRGLGYLLDASQTKT